MQLTALEDVASIGDRHRSKRGPFSDVKDALNSVSFKGNWG